MREINAKERLLALVLLLAILFSILAHAGSIPLEEFIDTFDFSINTGDINVTGFNDSMVDNSNNGMNDTLVVTLHTSTTAAGDYLFLIDALDKNSTISNLTRQTMAAGTVDVNISLDATLLSGSSMFNYSVNIFDSSNNIVYRKDKVQTNAYANYDKGTNITGIADANIGNNLIRITVTLNVTKTETTNITVFMRYNDSIISSSKQVSLTANPSPQTVDIDFDNETIKSTHYNGNFLVNRVQIGDRTFPRDYTTTTYNYEDFAKTSYLKSYADGKIDLNSDNQSEALQLNFTLNVKSPDSFIIQGEIRNQFNDFVLNFTNTTVPLTVGIKTVSFNVSGVTLYQSKINGPYRLGFVNLSNASATYDTTVSLYTLKSTNLSSDFEPPPLSDITINMSVNFTKTTNITVIGINISNIGNATAYNVLMDLFDNVTFNYTNFTEKLGVGQIRSFVLSLPNTAANTIYTAIVDFNDFVEESNESNNVATNTGNKTEEPNPGWWDGAWQHRQFLNITNNLTNEVLPIDYTINFTIDTATLISTNKLNTDCSDLRIIYKNTTELEWAFQFSSECNKTNSVIAFALDSNISSFDDKNYSLYYGNTMASFPMYDDDNVYLFRDDFGNASYSGPLDATKWQWSLMADEPNITNGVLIFNSDNGIDWQDYVQTIKTYNRHYYNLTLSWSWLKQATGSWSLAGYQNTSETNKGAQIYDNGDHIYASRQGLNFDLQTVAIPAIWYGINVKPHKNNSSFYQFNRSNTTLSPEDKNQYHFGLLDGNQNDIYRIDNLTIQYFAVSPPLVALLEEQQNASTEAEGRNAIEQGINSSLGTDRSLYTDQKIYIRYSDNVQKWGSFDKFTSSGQQRWAFNYVTGFELFTDMGDLDNKVFIWENQSLTSDEIRFQVSQLINQTMD